MIPVLEFLGEVATKVVLKKAIDYGVEKSFNFVGKNFFMDDEEDYGDSELSKEIFDIINSEPTILNYKKEEYCAKLIKSKVIEKYSEYDEIDLDYFEGFIHGVKGVVKLRRTIFDTLKYNPNMIKSSDSSIKKQIYDNFEVDEESEEYLSQEIDRVKRIFELYKKGKSPKEIFEDSIVFEFETAQFIKIFNHVN